MNTLYIKQNRFPEICGYLLPHGKIFKVGTVFRNWKTKLEIIGIENVCAEVLLKNCKRHHLVSGGVDIALNFQADDTQAL